MPLQSESWRCILTASSYATRMHIEEDLADISK